MWADGRAGSREADSQAGGQKHIECRKANEIDRQADGQTGKQAEGSGTRGHADRQAERLAGRRQTDR